MTDRYEVVVLSSVDSERLRRSYSDLMFLADCPVPAVRAAARAALAHVAQALNGQGLAYDLYTIQLAD